MLRCSIRCAQDKAQHDTGAVLRLMHREMLCCAQHDTGAVPCCVRHLSSQAAQIMNVKEECLVPLHGRRCVFLSIISDDGKLVVLALKCVNHQYDPYGQ